MTRTKKKNQKNKIVNYIKFLLPLSLLIPISFLLLMWILSQQALENPATPTTNNTESTEISDTQYTSTTSREQTDISMTQSSHSYAEQIELPFVEQPVKRTREEALVKIQELARWYPALYFVYQNESKYPIELLLSGAGNPEMADFLYGYLNSDGTITGGFTAEEQPQDHPLFLQFDPRWGYLEYGVRGTVGSSGCGPACLSMAIFYLTGDRTCTPGSAAQYSLENNYYIDGIGTSWTLLTDYPAEFGLTSTQISYDETTLKENLDKGHYIICSVRPGNFTSTGHFILIYGYDENGFKINDPKCVYRSRLPWTYEQIRNDIKAAWSVGK